MNSVLWVHFPYLNLFTVVHQKFLGPRDVKYLNTGLHVPYADEITTYLHACFPIVS